MTTESPDKLALGDNTSQPMCLRVVTRPKQENAYQDESLGMSLEDSELDTSEYETSETGAKGEGKPLRKAIGDNVGNHRNITDSCNQLQTTA